MRVAGEIVQQPEFAEDGDVDRTAERFLQFVQSSDFVAQLLNGHGHVELRRSTIDRQDQRSCRARASRLWNAHGNQVNAKLAGCDSCRYYLRAGPADPDFEFTFRA